MTQQDSQENFKKINGKSILEILILRIKKSKLVDKIVVAQLKKKMIIK